MASKLEGVKELTGALNQLGRKTAARELVGTVKAALELAEHRARAYMPQGTEPHKTYRGRLVAPGYALTTLHIETRLNKRTGAAVASLGPGREAFYVVQFQELGTRFHPAQPWLRPAFEESADEMQDAIADELRRRVESIKARNARAEARFYRRSR